MKKISTSILLLLTTFAIGQLQSLSLQTTTLTNQNLQTKSSSAPIWGVGASIGVSDGEFSNAFVQSTTASGYAPNS